jgi:hypothetical protein
MPNRKINELFKIFPIGVKIPDSNFSVHQALAAGSVFGATLKAPRSGMKRGFLF